MTLKNIRLKVVFSTHLLVHTAADPTEEEWMVNINTILEHQAVIKGIFVYTMGGGPTAMQRSLYNKTLEKAGLKPRVAVLSGSAMVRGIIQAFNWVQGNSMKMFPLDNIDQACIHLQLPPMERAAVATELQRFKKDLKL